MPYDRRWRGAPGGGSPSPRQTGEPGLLSVGAPVPGKASSRRRVGPPRGDLREHDGDPPHQQTESSDMNATDDPGPNGTDHVAPDPEADIFDATNPAGIEQLPAVMTSMTPAAFKNWLDAEGELFMVLLPGRASFVIKVPTVHNAFFVSMMQQVKFALGPEVQAVRMNVVRGDPPAADGTADEAPQWAQPAGHEGEHTIHEPTEHVYTDKADS